MGKEKKRLFVETPVQDVGQAEQRSAGQGGARTHARGRWGLVGVLVRASTLLGSLQVLPARHLRTSKGKKTSLAARERALLPCFWDNLNLSMFSK